MVSINGLTAIDIGNLSDKCFTTGECGRALILDNLPTSFISSTSYDISNMGVLSWRWDVDPVSNSSRNAYIAFQEAKRQGVKYFFMDIVSVDQKLQDDALMQQTVDFSEIYQYLPVFAAYDKKGQDSWLWTMRRLWIYHEVMLYRTNPTRVTYVGHIPKQGCEKDFGFLHMVDQVWATTLCRSILYVLVGKIDMFSISDLRFLLPKYVNVLNYAYDMMSKNDYLLTAALLSQLSYPAPRVNRDQDIHPLNYEKYQFIMGKGGYHYDVEILLNERKIGTWNVSVDSAGYLRHFLRVEPQTEQIILQFLGMPEISHFRFKQSSGNLQKQDKVKNPDLSVVFIED